MLRLKRLDCNCRGADRIDEAGKQLETYGRMDTRSGQWGCIDKTMNLQSRRRGGEEKRRGGEEKRRQGTQRHGRREDLWWPCGLTAPR
jgi:hypothetical protein